MQSPMLMRVDAWSAFPWLWHGFSTRHGGVSTVYSDAGAHSELNLGWNTEDDSANVAVNRLLLASAATKDAATPLFTLRQIHSGTSLVVQGAASYSSFVDSRGRATREGDGLIAAAQGVLLGILTADCVPVLVADTKNRVVAAFHAGWRGTASRVVEQGIGAMRSAFGCDPKDFIAAVGPSIGACCYTVGEEVYTTFAEEFQYGDALFRKSSGGSLYLDLWEANRRQLSDCGVSSSQIKIVGECTGCTGIPDGRRYFSHRCEHGVTGRLMSVIGIVPDRSEAQDPGE